MNGQVHTCMCFCLHIMEAINSVLFMLPSTPTACQLRA